MGERIAPRVPYRRVRRNKKREKPVPTYNVPNFNLTCAIYKSDPTLNFALLTFRLFSPCQLRGFGRVPSPTATQAFNLPTGLLASVCDLYLPALTDIRDLSCNGGNTDVVEVPAGSGRWYYVGQVDDVAKGFSNEYRRARLTKVFQGSTTPTFPLWPTPIP
jgi:hypothetical protein